MASASLSFWDKKREMKFHPHSRIFQRFVVCLKERMGAMITKIQEGFL